MSRKNEIGCRDIIDRYMMTGKIWCRIMECCRHNEDEFLEFSFDWDDVSDLMGDKPVKLTMDDGCVVLFDGINVKDDSTIEILYADRDRTEYCVSSTIWFTVDALKAIYDIVDKYCDAITDDSDEQEG